MDSDDTVGRSCRKPQKEAHGVEGVSCVAENLGSGRLISVYAHLVGSQTGGARSQLSNSC